MKDLDAGLSAILADIERERTPEHLLQLALKLQKVLAEGREVGDRPPVRETFDDSAS